MFVIGFLLMATARSVGLRDFTIAGRSASDLASDGASATILVALAGIGLQTDVRALAAVGPRPLRSRPCSAGAGDRKPGPDPGPPGLGSR